MINIKNSKIYNEMIPYLSEDIFEFTFLKDKILFDNFHNINLMEDKFNTFLIEKNEFDNG